MDQTDEQTSTHIEALLEPLKDSLNNLTSVERFTPVEADREDFLVAVKNYVQEVKLFQQTNSAGPSKTRLVSAYNTYARSSSEDERTKAFYDLLGFATDVAFRYKGHKSNTLVSEFTARSTKRVVVGLSTSGTRFRLLVAPLVKLVNKSYLTNDQVRDGLKDLVLADAKAVDKLTKLLESPTLNLNGNARHRYALYIAAHKVERSQRPTQD